MTSPTLSIKEAFNAELQLLSLQVTGEDYFRRVPLSDLDNIAAAVGIPYHELCNRMPTIRGVQGEMTYRHHIARLYTAKVNGCRCLDYRYLLNCPARCNCLGRLNPHP